MLEPQITTAYWFVASKKLCSHKREARDDLPQPPWQSITQQIRELHSSRSRAHLE